MASQERTRTIEARRDLGDICGKDTTTAAQRKRKKEKGEEKLAEDAFSSI